jgi:biopolymer transport protein ExbD
MKRFTQKSAHSGMAELNITPLLDLAFVLLIIFVITTPLLENTIDVNLPVATQSKGSVDPTNLKTISIDPKGRIYVEKDAVADTQLDRVLLRLKASHPDLTIAVRADRDIAYQRVIVVLDALKRTNISKVGLVHNEP